MATWTQPRTEASRAPANAALDKNAEATRVCSICKLEKPLTAEHFYADTRDALRGWEQCKMCLSRVSKWCKAGWSHNDAVEVVKSALGNAANSPTSSEDRADSTQLRDDAPHGLEQSAANNTPAEHRADAETPPERRKAPSNAWGSVTGALEMSVAKSEPATSPASSERCGNGAFADEKPFDRQAPPSGTESPRAPPPTSQAPLPLDLDSIQLSDTRVWPDHLHCREIAAVIARADLPLSKRATLLDALATLSDNTVKLELLHPGLAGKTKAGLTRSDCQPDRTASVGHTDEHAALPQPQRPPAQHALESALSSAQTAVVKVLGAAPDAAPFPHDAPKAALDPDALREAAEGLCRSAPAPDAPAAWDALPQPAPPPPAAAKPLPAAPPPELGGDALFAWLRNVAVDLQKGLRGGAAAPELAPAAAQPPFEPAALAAARAAADPAIPIASLLRPVAKYAAPRSPRQGRSSPGGGGSPRGLPPRQPPASWGVSPAAAALGLTAPRGVDDVTPTLWLHHAPPAGVPVPAEPPGTAKRPHSDLIRAATDLLLRMSRERQDHTQPPPPRMPSGPMHDVYAATVEPAPIEDPAAARAKYRRLNGAVDVHSMASEALLRAWGHAPNGGRQDKRSRQDDTAPDPPTAPPPPPRRVGSMSKAVADELDSPPNSRKAAAEKKAKDDEAMIRDGVGALLMMMEERTRAASGSQDSKSASALPTAAGENAAADDDEDDDEDGEARRQDDEEEPPAKKMWSRGGRDQNLTMWWRQTGSAQGMVDAVDPAKDRPDKRANASKCSSIYRGVSWHGPSKQWRASIFAKKPRHLGYFATEKESACVYDLAAVQLRSAANAAKYLNFPENLPIYSAKVAAGEGPLDMESLTVRSAAPHKNGNRPANKARKFDVNDVVSDITAMAEAESGGHSADAPAAAANNTTLPNSNQLSSELEQSLSRLAHSGGVTLGDMLRHAVQPSSNNTPHHQQGP